MSERIRRSRLSSPLVRLRLRALGRPLLAVTLGLVVAGLLVLLTGKDPAAAAVALVKGSIGSPSAIAGTLSLATPLLFSALAFAVAFRGSMFNAGVDGQLLIGAFASAVVGFSFDLPAIIHVPLMLAAGAAGGAFWAFLPAIWRVTLGANEVVTTLMMNFIAAALTDYFVLYPFRAAGQSGSAIKTAPIAASAELPRIWEPYSVTVALPIAIVCCGLVWFGLRRLVVGYEVRMVGTSPGFARASGIDPGRRQVAVMLLSGGLAGLAGAAQVGGVFHAFVSPFAANLGFNGVLVSLLVGNSPVGIPVGAGFVAALQSGAISMELTTTISRYIVGALTAIIIIFVAARRIPWLEAFRARRRAVRAAASGG